MNKKKNQKPKVLTKVLIGTICHALDVFIELAIRLFYIFTAIGSDVFHSPAFILDT